MKVIMTGGGTGGHIYPALAIAEEIKRRDEKAEILFIGAEVGMERDIVPKYGYDIELIEADGFYRTNVLQNVKTVKKLISGNRKSRKIMEAFKPDFVIGTGGYASVSVVKTAQKMKIPTYIHEQNAFAGMSNKVLESKVKNVFLGFEAASKYFKQPEKQVFCGNPVRKEFIEASREESRNAMGIRDDEFTILAFGGSQGAGKLNQSMLKIIETFNGVEGMRIILGTGSYYYEPIKKEFMDKGVKLSDNITILEYIEDMPKYLSASDLIISRSGALSVAEIAVCGVPAIFIPSPNVTGNHQYFNAKAIEENGGAIIVEEKDLDNNELISTIHHLKNDAEALKDMAKKCKSCGKTHAAEIIVDTVIKSYKE